MDQKRDTGWKLLLAVVCVVLFFSNFVRIFDNCLWGDEAFSAQLIKMNLSELIQTTGQDVHPPLYYLLLKAFTGFFGINGWSMHLFSLLPLGILYLFIYIKGRYIWGNAASVLFSVFLGSSQIGIVYNLEIRMYSWSMLFVILAFYFGFELYKNESVVITWILFILSGLGAAYTHYYALISVAILYIVIYALLIMKNVKNIKRCVVSGVITCMGYLPWLFVLIEQFKKTSKSYWISYIPKGQEAFNFLFGASIWGKFIGCLSIVIVMAFFFKKIVFESIIRKERKANDEAFLMVFSSILVVMGTFLFGLLISVLIRPMFIVRYLVPSTGLLWLGISISFQSLKLKEWMEVAICSGCIGLSIPGYCALVQKEYYYEKGTQEVVEYLNHNMKVDDILVTDIPELAWTVLDYYFENNNMLYSQWYAEIANNGIEESWQLISIPEAEEREEQWKKMNLHYKWIKEGNIDAYKFKIYRIKGNGS